MEVIGIDLAALPKNKTGFCRLKNNQTTIKITKTNEEIEKEVSKYTPQLIAIDGPLSKPKKGDTRKCDEEISAYGSLPPLKSSGMQKLMKRAIKISQKLEKNCKTIEVKPFATAKTLGIKRKEGEEQKTQKQLLKMGLKGTIEKRMLNIDEIDATLAALTAKLHLNGKTEEKGNKKRKIIIPKTGV